mmetsp:Transcript_28335/g.77539  ORF Transcript_28335/g.77539 Transcript_28335/m.77539 type:complete len:126 (-) Transcript_28335:1498-1875(-)
MLRTMTGYLHFVFELEFLDFRMPVANMPPASRTTDREPGQDVGLIDAPPACTDRFVVQIAVRPAIRATCGRIIKRSTIARRCNSWRRVKTLVVILGGSTRGYHITANGDILDGPTECNNGEDSNQ